MKSSKICLLIQHVTLLFFSCPNVSCAVEPDSAPDNLIQRSNIEVNYLCVQFKKFPILLLCQWKEMAAAIEKEIPEGPSIGREKKDNQGYLLVSYQQKDEGVLLTMSFHRLSGDSPLHSDDEETPSLLSLQCLLVNPSSTMIADTLRDLFSSFIFAWEKNRIPADEEEIALFNKDLNRPT